MNKRHWLKILNKNIMACKEENIDLFSSFKISNAFDVFEDQKIFLNASEVLEKLNVILKYVEVKQNAAFQIQTSEKNNLFLYLKYALKLKEVVIFYDRLKKLLLLRYFLLLKKEYICCIGKNEIIFKKSLLLTSIENQKTKKSNQFPQVDCNNFCGSEILSLIEQLSKIICQWQAVFLNYQKMVTIFHSGFDIQQHNIFSCADFHLYCVYENFINFISMCFHIIIERFKLSDLGDSSINFMPKILEIFEIFQTLSLYKKSYKNDLKCCKFTIKSFRSLKTLDTCQFSCDTVLSIFGQLQANLTANKLMHTITTEIQKDFKINKEFSYNWLPYMPLDKNCKHSEETSDYCSESTSEANSHDLEFPKISHIKVLPLNHLSSNLFSVINSSLQKRDSFILRYLFIIKQQNRQVTKHVLSEENSVKESYSNIASRKIWKFSPDITNKSCSEIKNVYWIQFWKTFCVSLVKLFIEVPYCHFNDSLNGSLLMCRESFIIELMEYLKKTSNFNGCPDDGQQYIKYVYNFIFFYSLKMSWDKRFCLALTATHFQKYSVVPLENGNSGTYSGNLLNVMLQPLLSGLIFCNSNDVEHVTLINVLNQLLSSIYYFENWIIIREQISLSSWNILHFLFISFDTKRFLDLINDNIISKKLNYSFNKQSLYFTSFVNGLQKNISEINDGMKAQYDEVLTVMYKKSYATSKQFLVSQILSIPFWKHTKCIKRSNNCMTRIIDEVLYPVCQSIDLIKNDASVFKNVLKAVLQAYMDIATRKKLRSYEVRSMIDNINELTVWLNEMNLFSNISDLFEIFDNLFRILKSLSSTNLNVRVLTKSRNSVCPLILPNEVYTR